MPIIDLHSNRRDSRVNVGWSTRFHDERGTTADGVIMDLSPNGLFLRPPVTGPELTPGTRVRLLFQGSDGAEIDVRGTVRWGGASQAHGCTGFGVEFDARQPTVIAFFGHDRWNEDAVSE